MKSTPSTLCAQLLSLALLCGAGCTHLPSAAPLADNRELLRTDVTQLAPIEDVALDEMPTGVWVQLQPTEPAPHTPIEEPETGPYRLGVGDELLITIYGYDEANSQRTLPIDPSGNITYMLLGTIPAAGRTIDELTTDMRARLKKQLNYAIVNIIPARFGSQTFTVLGQMRFPQVYHLEGRMNLLEALAQAGGMAQGSVRNVTADIHDLAHATLIRRGEVVPVDFEKLVYEADATQNIAIRSGDIIFIPSALERKVYAIGSFNSPQSIQFARSSLSLIHAVVQAGGMSEEYSDGHILIIRGNTRNPKVMLMDLSQFDVKKARAFKILSGRALDVQLKPGDIVYAVPKKFKFLRDVTQEAVNTFGTALAGSAARDLYDRELNPFSLREE